MDIAQFGKRKTGRLIKIGNIPGVTHCFIPEPLRK